MSANVATLSFRSMEWIDDEESSHRRRRRHASRSHARSLARSVRRAVVQQPARRSPPSGCCRRGRAPRLQWLGVGCGSVGGRVRRTVLLRLAASLTHILQLLASVSLTPWSRISDVRTFHPSVYVRWSCNTTGCGKKYSSHILQFSRQSLEMSKRNFTDIFSHPMRDKHNSLYQFIISFQRF